MIKDLLLLMRPRHWVKNIFIFLPLFFSGHPLENLNAHIWILFIVFCLTASSIYVINDIFDIEKDRLHPEKKNRPLASGKINRTTAWTLFAILTGIVLATCILLLPESRHYVMGYFVLNILYSFKLKHISILDISCISLGFVFRVLAGGKEAGILVSHWMIILVFLLTISMVFAKRRDDFAVGVDQNLLRKSNSGYSIVFLDIATSISFSITLIAYIAFSVDPGTMERLGSSHVYFSSFFVFLGIMRYIQISVIDRKAGSPVDVLLKDSFLQFTVLGWALTILYLVYG